METSTLKISESVCVACDSQVEAGYKLCCVCQVALGVIASQPDLLDEDDDEDERKPPATAYPSKLCVDFGAVVFPSDNGSVSNPCCDVCSFAVTESLEDELQQLQQDRREALQPTRLQFGFHHDKESTSVAAREFINLMNPTASSSSSLPHGESTTIQQVAQPSVSCVVCCAPIFHADNNTSSTPCCRVCSSAMSQSLEDDDFQDELQEESTRDALQPTRLEFEKECTTVVPQQRQHVISLLSPETSALASCSPAAPAGTSRQLVFAHDKNSSRAAKDRSSSLGRTSPSPQVEVSRVKTVLEAINERYLEAEKLGNVVVVSSPRSTRKEEDDDEVVIVDAPVKQEARGSMNNGTYSNTSTQQVTTPPHVSTSPLSTREEEKDATRFTCSHCGIASLTGFQSRCLACHHGTHHPNSSNKRPRS